MQTKTWMDSAQQYLKIILIEHAEKRHGPLYSNVNTWHENIIREMT